MKKTIILISLFCIPFLGTAQTTQEKTVTDNSWNFSVTPYLWMSSLKGDITVLSQESSVNLQFTDEIISNLQMVGMIHAEANHKRLSIMLDASYANLNAKGEAKNTLKDRSVELDLKQTIIELGIGYSFVKVNNFSLDALVGARYFDMNIDLEFKGNDILLNKEFDFVEPYVGLQLRNYWGKWSVGGRIDAGGFGAGSEISYNYNALVAYQFTDLFGLTLGYQAYKPNYQEELFKYNVGNEGFLVGFIFKF